MAVAEIYGRVKNKCMAAAVKITRDQALAEDALHSAFVKILERKSKFLAMPCHKQDAYIVIMVKNKAIDIMRGRNRAGSIEDHEPADIFDVAQDYESGEAYAGLKELIKALPPIYRAVFELRYIVELDNGQIAKALGIKKSAVAKRLERARHKLKQKIKENYHEK